MSSLATENLYTEDLHTMWHPIASADDTPLRMIFHGQLLGRELAVWRADDGFVNVWENRCLHRGVRLTIGRNNGYELSCRYHGWRYASRSAGCTYIPAHPADAPAQTICNTTFPVLERYGLIWSASRDINDMEPVASLETGDAFALRGLPFNAPAAVARDLLKTYSFQPNGQGDVTGATTRVSVAADLMVELVSSVGDDETTTVLFIQPVDSDRCVVRGVLNRRPPAGTELETLRRHARELERIRDLAESRASLLPALAPMEVDLVPVPVELASMPERAPSGGPSIRVVVSRKWLVAEGVMAFELSPVSGQLPTSQPGAHIDVGLPGGLVRQYSLTNRSGDSSSYVIGVKREPKSRGGSTALHDSVAEGDVLLVSAPRNNFPLRRDAEQTILIAGGIGVTPLLSMAQTLHESGQRVALHYFAQSDAHLAFGETLTRLGSDLVLHLGLSPDETGSMLTEILASQDSDSHVYICGPGPMLDAARHVADEAGWPDGAVHFEYFKNTNEIDDSSSFEISLARSAKTLTVEAGQTILDVLRESGVALPSSCEQGACGTCLVGVVEGEPDHQDVYLNRTEREAGQKILTCVSRSKSDRLVLDI